MVEKNLLRDIKNEEKKLKELQKQKQQQQKEQAKKKTKLANIGKLKRELYAKTKERNGTEAELNRPKPHGELEERYETLKRENEDDRKIIDDDNATSSDKQAATERIIERDEEIARLEPQI